MDDELHDLLDDDDCVLDLFLNVAIVFPVSFLRREIGVIIYNETQSRVYRIRRGDTLSTVRT